MQDHGAGPRCPHGEIGRLVGVGESMSHDGKIDKMISGSLLSVEFRLDGLV